MKIPQGGDPDGGAVQGGDPQDSPPPQAERPGGMLPETRVRRYLLAIGLAAALTVLLAFGLFRFLSGQARAGIIDLSIGAAVSGLFAAVILAGPTRAIGLVASAVIGSIMLYLVWEPGLGGHGFQWSYAFPVGVFFAIGARGGKWWSASFLLAFTLLVAAGERLGGMPYTLGDKIELPVALLIVTVLAFALEHLRELHQAELVRERERLVRALLDVKELSGLLPICASCKKIRDDKGYWSQVEDYLRRRTDVQFTHSLCPDCGQRLYGSLWKST